MNKILNLLFAGNNLFHCVQMEINGIETANSQFKNVIIHQHRCDILI